MTKIDELMKRLNALYLVVDASVAKDIHDHTLEVVKERDALRVEVKKLEKVAEAARKLIATDMHAVRRRHYNEERAKLTIDVDAALAELEM